MNVKAFFGGGGGGGDDGVGGGGWNGTVCMKFQIHFLEKENKKNMLKCCLLFISPESDKH